LLEVQKLIGLPSPALVEKDWYVVKAISAIAKINVEPFQLVFSGGTALSRAYLLVGRMSEDIDLKIIFHEKPQRRAFRNLRDRITDALLQAGFQFNPQNPLHRECGNASRYTLYRLPYTPVAAGEGTLRPEIQVETAVWPLRKPAIMLPVRSFVAEVFNNPPEVPAIPCVALSEMIAEKFVALTRRAGAELSNAGGPRDPALIRHVYDLYIAKPHYDLADAAILAREIMLADAKAYGHQFPAYRENPVAETLRAVNGLVTDPGFAGRYSVFLRDMVYGEHVDFATAITVVVALASQLKVAKEKGG